MVRNKLSKNQSGDVGSPLLYGIHQKNNNRAKFQDIYKYSHCIPEHISLFSWTTASLKIIFDLVYVNFSLSDDYACAFWSINASFHKENLCCQIGTENGQINEAIQLELLC